MMNSDPATQPHSPTAIAQKAAAMPWKENARVNISPYGTAILSLRERGYSFGEIATWLSTELNAPVKRGQVYYVCQQLAALDAADSERSYDEAKARGELHHYEQVKLTEDQAERAAGAEDMKGKNTRGKQKGKK